MTATQQQIDENSEQVINDGEGRSQVLSNLLTVSTYLVSVLNSSEIIAGIVHRVVQVVPAVQAGQLWLYDRLHQHITLASFSGHTESASTEALQCLSLRVGEGLPGIVLQRGESVLLDRRSYRELSARVSQRNVASIRTYLGTLPRDVQGVALPLRIGNEVIGVLELLNLGSRPHLQRTDLQALQTFANLAAGAIKNAQLHEQMHAYQRRLEAFSAIGTVVSTAADLDELVANVLDVMLGVVQTTSGALYLLDLARSAIVLRDSRNLPPDYHDGMQVVPIVGADFEEAVRYGQPVRRPLIAEGSEELLLAHGYAGCAYIPLLAGGTVVGVLGLFGDSSLPERVDVQTLMMTGNLIGFAIANVRLYQESQTERRTLSAVISSIAEGVALCDRDGRLLLMNQTARELLLAEQSMASNGDMNLFSTLSFRDLDGQALAHTQIPIFRALSGEVYHDYRVQLRGIRGHETVMSFTGAPVYGDQNQVEGAVMIFRDVTMSQKLERAKDDFLAVAAHELRSPLAAVRGYTDLLMRREQRRGSEDSSPEMRGLHVLGQQVGHMLRLVDSLLDVSRLDAGQFSLQLQRSNLVELAEQVIEQLRPTAGERQLLLEAPTSELTIICDSLRIRQVLTNLITNAIRYSPNATSINTHVWVQPDEQLASAHPAYAQLRGPRVESDMVAILSITDQGAGMSSEQIGRLFRRYERGRIRSGEGLGLGLYLSSQFVARHQGHLWVESQEGQGSTFFVVLPISGPDSANEADAPLQR